MNTQFSLAKEITTELYNPLGMITMVRNKSSPYTYGTSIYASTVNSVRHYLRKRDFLTYSFQLIPEPVGSETWSLAWGYIRQFDDITRSPTLTKNDALTILEQEQEILELGFEGNLNVPHTAPIRHRWLAQFFDNERKYYGGEALQVLRNLYECAWSNVARKGKILSQKDMDLHLYKKTSNFFKLYFILGGFDLRNHIDDFSYLLGMGLGMLDDILDMVSDYEEGYVNITREEMESLGIDLEPEDKGFLQQVIESGYQTLRAKKIMSVLLRARRLTRYVRVPLVRALLIRLTDIFASPILENKLIPGQRFFFKGSRMVDRFLPKNESIAYKIGHKFIRFVLMYPKVVSAFFRQPSATEDKHLAVTNRQAIDSVRMTSLSEERKTSDTYADLFEVDFRGRIIGLLESIAASEAKISAVELAKKVTIELAIEKEDLVNLVSIEAMNVLKRSEYTHVPIEKRVLLIPHCLRDPIRCKAPIDEEGYHCKKCGACIIADITRSAEEKGLKWYMVGGGSHAIRIIKNAQPRAVLGIACFDEAMMAIEKISEYGVPIQAVLLSKDGCVNTEVDFNAVQAKLDI
ncbi:MAG: DUF116 domain-containing protein [Candidatus Thorarchaeota archaeon]